MVTQLTPSSLQNTESVSTMASEVPHSQPGGGSGDGHPAHVRIGIAELSATAALPDGEKESQPARAAARVTRPRHSDSPSPRLRPCFSIFL